MRLGTSLPLLLAFIAPLARAETPAAPPAKAVVYSCSIRENSYPNAFTLVGQELRFFTGLNRVELACAPPVAKVTANPDPNLVDKELRFDCRAPKRERGEQVTLRGGDWWTRFEWTTSQTTKHETNSYAANFGDDGIVCGSALIEPGVKDPIYMCAYTSTEAVQVRVPAKGAPVVHAWNHGDGGNVTVGEKPLAVAPSGTNWRFSNHSQGFTLSTSPTLSLIPDKPITRLANLPVERLPCLRIPL